MLAAPPIASVAVLSVTAPVVLGPAFAMALGAFGLWLGIRKKKNANPGTHLSENEEIVRTNVR